MVLGSYGEANIAHPQPDFSVLASIVETITSTPVGVSDGLQRSLRQQALVGMNGAENRGKAGLHNDEFASGARLHLRVRGRHEGVQRHVGGGMRGLPRFDPIKSIGKRSLRAYQACVSRERTPENL